ncbi:MAG: dTDP-4-amino-4,6-dideoxygalactose transaminase [Crocinitomicaceae bacterium]|nr:dTDP-4-amino-4,6-dideoxygalactose transaminase [Crocinitomicaceae bacterium]
MIDFNLPYLTGDEEKYIFEAVRNGKISGNGKHTKLCQSFFENRYEFKKSLLTTSCTDALEMAALLSNLEEGDEVIVPSYTFVSSALAFVRERAKIVFADSLPYHPNIDTSKLEELITPKTRVIVVVHYAGVACDMDVVMELADKYNLFVVEDAAQAIDSTYKGKPLGSIGHFGTFSFHETKNIQCGEGGLLAINDDRFSKRAEIIWEKGTNRAEFFRGEINKYGWVDIGSSFLPSEITSAYLYAQLLHLDDIQSKRKAIWNRYNECLQELNANGDIILPELPKFATNNAHMFFILTKGSDERGKLIDHLRGKEIHAVFHYLALHNSEYYSKKHDRRELPNSVNFEKSLLRLPFFNDLQLDQVDYICESIKEFYKG